MLFRLVAFFAARDIDHGQALFDTSICGAARPDSMRRIHGFEHVFDQLVQFGRVELGRRARRAVRESDCSDI